MGQLENLKRSKLGLEYVPIFYPSTEEFECPLKYIASIRAKVETFGMCKIVPPAIWKPPFALNKNNFSFKTKVQAIHQLQERPSGCDRDTFGLDYTKFCKVHGLVLENWPVFDDEELDLCKLYSAVRRRGGSIRVSKEARWKDIHGMVFPEKKGAGEVQEALIKELQFLYDLFLVHYEQQHLSPGRPVDIQPEHKAAFLLRQKQSFSQLDMENSSPSLSPSIATKGEFHMQSEFIKDTQSQFDKALVKGLQDGIVKKIRRKLRSDPLNPPHAVSLKSVKRLDQKCEHCAGENIEKSMLLCDRCDKGWHMHCLSPPLTTLPPGNWYCIRCLNNRKESFGFATGNEHSLASFQRYADNFKRKWFDDEGLASLGPESLEKEFWHIVENSSKKVEVLYGSDIETSKSGSGFPRRTDACPPGENVQLWQKYANSPWNLNNIAKLNGSVLRFFDDEVSGVIVPWLYIGMTFSSFCWHFEDHSLYSINYLHWGEGKQWYGVPGSAADAFEDVMKNSFPDLFEAQPDLLFQLVTMLNPTVLKSNGVPVFSCLQQPGEFVITFPRSYHGGFNLGFNCAEAVNFAPPDWLPWGAKSIQRFRHFRRSSILSQEELLIAIVRMCLLQSTDEFPETRSLAVQELKKVIEAEKYNRTRVWANGTVRSQRMTARKVVGRITKEEDACCIVCKYFLHISALTCACRPGKAVCLEDAEYLCDCPASKKTLAYRYSLAELEDLLKNESSSHVQPGRCLRSKRDFKRRRELPHAFPADTSSPSGQETLPAGAETHEQGLPVPPLPKKNVQGSLLGHSEAAEQWARDVKSTVQKAAPTLRTVEGLLQRGEEFLWGGHEVDLDALGVRGEWEKMKKVKQWADDVAVCCGAMSAAAASTSSSSGFSFGSSSSSRSFSSSKKDHRGRGLPLAKAEALLAENPLQCYDAKAKELATRLRQIQGFREKVLRAIQSNPPVDHVALQDLYMEALKAPIEIPELKSLKDALSDIAAWTEAVHRFLPTHKGARKRPFADSSMIGRLLKLQVEGEKLLATTEEHSLLRNAILSVERWKAKAEALLEGKPTLHEVSVLLEGAGSLPVVVSEREMLRDLVDEAKRWQERVKRAMADSSSSGGYRAISELEKLIGEAFLLPVEVDTSEVEAEVRARQWIVEAEEALAEGAKLGVVEYLAMEAEGVGATGPAVQQLLEDLKSSGARGEEEAPSWMDSSLHGQYCSVELNHI